MHELNAFQRDLLRVAAGFDSASGLDLKEELEAYYEKEIHHARLYPNLDTLVEEGLLEKGKQDGRTNTYDVTSQGEVTMRSHDRWKESVRETGKAPTA